MGSAGVTAARAAPDVADVAAASTAGYLRLDEVQGSNYVSEGLKGRPLQEADAGRKSFSSWRQVILCTFLITLLLVAFRVRRAEVTPSNCAGTTALLGLVPSSASGEGTWPSL
eukprot:s3552_g4.t1